MKQHKRLEEYISRYQEDVKFYQDAFLRERLLGSRELSDEKIYTRMKYLNLCLDGPSYCVVIFAPYLMEKEAREIDHILANMLFDIQIGYQAKNIKCHTVSDGYCNAIAILSFQTKEEYQQIEKTANLMAKKIISNYGIKLYVGIGNVVEKISLICKSRALAAEALGYKYTFSQDNIIYSKDVKQYYNQGVIDLKQHYDWIMGCFYDGNIGKMSERLHNLQEIVSAISPDTLHSMKNIYIELTAMIQRKIYEMGINETLETTYMYTDIISMKTVEQIEGWFIEYCRNTLSKIEDLRENKSRQFIKNAEEYIAHNLGNRDLTIQAISDYVGLSPAYFSNVFFRETGCHVNEYINSARIKYAQMLLLTTNEKIVSVSEKSGFSSASYFNNIFKRYSGMSPKQYRKFVNV